MITKLILAVVLLAAVLAATAWPRLNTVETGRTPEYPDLQEREYRASERAVTEAVKRAIAGLSRWSLIGSGQGPGGSALQAVAATRVFRFKDDVTIRIRRSGGATRVNVVSRSRVGKWDFGQNARNVRELLAALDTQLDR